jgi:hypothetical protein
MKKKKLNNLNDIRYHKLLLKTQMRHKEEKIKKSLKKINNEIHTINFKNDILAGIVNNPSLIINNARITYDLVSRFRRWRKNRKKSR